MNYTLPLFCKRSPLSDSVIQCGVDFDKYPGLDPLPSLVDLSGGLQHFRIARGITQHYDCINII